jgi:hypothetical protein
LVTTVAAEAGTDVLTASPPVIIARAIAVAIMVRMGHSFSAVLSHGSLAGPVLMGEVRAGFLDWSTRRDLTPRKAP